jgi:dTDP-glucose pyrophosphorylase
MPFHEETIWRQSTIESHNTIGDAISNLDKSGLQISLVVDAQGYLLGTVTDGDVRRALLRGLDLRSPVDAIMNPDPLVVTSELGRQSVMNLMRANKVHQLPVVDEQRNVVGLHTWDGMLTARLRTNTMVIMAGGFGTRLRPYTEDRPKPMLPVAGKPMLEHIIERAHAEGFVNFIISLHYLGHIITDYFGDGAGLGVNINYIHEETPLGTAGALFLIDPRPEDSIIVTNGDVLTDVRYGEMLDFHLGQHAQATMAVSLHEWQHPFGVVRTEGIEIVGFDEKPIHRSHVNAGIYVLEPQVLDLLQPEIPCDMPNLFAKTQLSDGKTIAYPMHEQWMDVGRPEDLENANVENSSK